jgi:hypothetical protein
MSNLSQFWRSMLAGCNADVLQALELFAQTVIARKPPIDFGYIGPFWDAEKDPNGRILMDRILWDVQDGNIARFDCDRCTLLSHLVWCLVDGPQSAVYQRAVYILNGDNSDKFSDLRKLVN